MAKPKNEATKLLAVLAIAAILVMGVGTFVLVGALQPNVSQPTSLPSTAQGRVTAYVIPHPVATTGHVYVDVLP